MKKILLTGASGLIGRQTFKTLTDGGYEIVTVGNSELNNISEFDLTEKSLNDALENDFDLVVHLAAEIPRSDNKDVHTINEIIDRNVFEFVAEREIPLIYASSGSVYGSKYQESTIKESLSSYPESDYAKQKLRSETWIKQNLKSYYICRITAPYGISNRYQGVLNTFCKRVLENKEIILYGTGSRCQDFIHVSDVADLIQKIIKSPKSKSGIYNVSAGSPISMKEVAEMILRLAGRQGKIIYSETKDVQESFRALYDIKKATEMFDWNPKITLEEGIDELLSFLKGKNNEAGNNL